ncbi:MAG: substrate-binding domain-containing protein [Acidimicrobiales bacterium]
MLVATIFATFVFTMALAGCGDDDGGGEDPQGSSDPGTVTVAVAPIAEPGVQALADAYEADHPDTQIELQPTDMEEMTSVVSDASADIAVYPDPWVTEPDSSIEVVPFARNTAIIIVPEGNPEGIEDVSAFAPDSELTTQICGTQTPLGSFILAVLANAGVTVDDEALEEGCESEAAQQVADGELDAAAMYSMNVVVPEGAEAIEVAEDVNIIVPLSAATLTDSDAAADFAAFMTSEEASSMLTEIGYLP